MGNGQTPPPQRSNPSLDLSCWVYVKTLSADRRGCGPSVLSGEAVLHGDGIVEAAQESEFLSHLVRNRVCVPTRVRSSTGGVRFRSEGRGTSMRWTRPAATVVESAWVALSRPVIRMMANPGRGRFDGERNNSPSRCGPKAPTALPPSQELRAKSCRCLDMLEICGLTIEVREVAEPKARAHHPSRRR